MMFLIIGFILGAILGIIRAIVGDTIFYTLSALLGIYMIYTFFSIFGMLWGMIIIVGFIMFLLVGLYELAKDAGNLISSFFGR